MSDPRARGRQDPARNAASGRIGKAVEYLVAATCILSSRSELNVSTALVDDEGVDLVFHRRGQTATLAVQVKSRAVDSVPLNRGLMQAFIRSQTFQPREDFHLLFVAIDIDAGTFDRCWLVPSVVIAERLKPRSMRRLVFTASMKPNTRDRWAQYRLGRTDLSPRLMSLLEGRSAP